MAHVTMTTLFVGFLLAFGACQASVVRMTSGPSAVLEKILPNVKGFAEILTKKLGETDDLVLKISNTLTMDISLQLDALVLLGNSSGKFGFCCVCETCNAECTDCGRKCCCNGVGSCDCTSCTTSPMTPVRVDQVDLSTKSTSLKIWAESTRQLLTRDLRYLLVQYNPKATTDICCMCLSCQSFTMACGYPQCCKIGSQCGCLNCEGPHYAFKVDKVDHPAGLKLEAETAVQEVRHLVDRLLVLVADF